MKDEDTTYKSFCQFVPDHTAKCLACQETPCVVGVDEEGRVVYVSGMCGPCTFGTADAVDPEAW